MCTEALDLHINNSRVEIQSGETYSPVYGFDNLQLNDCYIAQPVGGYWFTDGDPETNNDGVYNADGTPFAGTLVIGQGEEPVIEYDVWVGGVRVTSANKHNITGPGISGSVVYDDDENTLTLTDVTLESVGSNTIGIDYYGEEEPLTIRFNGNNTIGTANAPFRDGIYCVGVDLTVTGGSNQDTMNINATLEGIDNSLDIDLGGWVNTWLGNGSFHINSPTPFRAYYSGGRNLVFSNMSAVCTGVTGEPMAGYEDVVLQDCHISQPSGGYFADGRSPSQLMPFLMLSPGAPIWLSVPLK